MTARWPSTLQPVSCMFGRDRNEAQQTDTASRWHYANQRSRPLWMCEASFEIHRDDESAFRDLIETADGQRTPYMIWDFSNPFPCLHPAIPRETYDWVSPSLPVTWTRGGTAYYWTREAIDYESLTLAVDASGSAGDVTVTLQGFPSSSTTLVRGDLVQIDEYLYMVSSNKMSNVSGVVTIDISTPLVAAITGASSVRVIEPAARMRVDQTEWSSSRTWNEPYSIVGVKFLEVA